MSDRITQWWTGVDQAGKRYPVEVEMVGAGRWVSAYQGGTEYACSMASQAAMRLLWGQGLDIRRLYGPGEVIEAKERPIREVIRAFLKASDEFNGALGDFAADGDEYARLTTATREVYVDARRLLELAAEGPYPGDPKGPSLELLVGEYLTTWSRVYELAGIDPQAPVNPLGEDMEVCFPAGHRIEAERRAALARAVGLPDPPSTPSADRPLIAAGIDIAQADQEATEKAGVSRRTTGFSRWFDQWGGLPSWARRKRP